MTKENVKSSDHEEPQRGVFSRSILEHRMLVARAEPLNEPSKEIAYVDIELPISNHVRLPARIYRPKGYNSEKLLPTLFYVPGTAFIASETKFTHLVCSHLCDKTGYQIIVINHRLAPEEQFPVGYQDAYKLLNFFTVIAPEFFNIDRQHVVISGYSSGGNFAALMAIEAKKQGIHVTRQILISPFVDLSRTLNAFKEFEDKDTDIKDEFVKWFLKLYIPPSISPKNPAISPFWVKQTDLKGLPPTDIILAEFDRFRSDAEAFYTKLRGSGVVTEKFMMPQAKHSYLWYKLEVVDKITERLTLALSDNQLSKDNWLLTIKPNPKNIEENRDNPSPSAHGSPFTLSKL
jgi:acetyl esterase